MYCAAIRRFSGVLVDLAAVGRAVEAAERGQRLGTDLLRVGVPPVAALLDAADLIGEARQLGVALRGGRDGLLKGEKGRKRA